MITIPKPPTAPSGTFGSYKIMSQPKKSLAPYLIIAVTIIILAAGYYFFFYRGISLSLEAPVFSSAPALTPLEVKVTQMPSFTLGVMESPVYKSLKIYGALPVTVGALGRINPFIPY